MSCSHWDICRQVKQARALPHEPPPKQCHIVWRKTHHPQAPAGPGQFLTVLGAHGKVYREMTQCGSGFRDSRDEIGMCVWTLLLQGPLNWPHSDSRPLVSSRAWAQATWAPANSRRIIRGSWAGLRRCTGKSGPVQATVGARAQSWAPLLSRLQKPSAGCYSAKNPDQ